MHVFNSIVTPKTKYRIFNTNLNKCTNMRKNISSKYLISPKNNYRDIIYTKNESFNQTFGSCFNRKASALVQLPK